MDVHGIYFVMKVAPVQNFVHQHLKNTSDTRYFFLVIGFPKMLFSRHFIGTVDG